LFRKADASVFLPGQQDVNALRDEIIIFLTRIVSEHLQQYKPYENEIQKHIPSKYSNEMATKSNVVGSISFFEYCYKIILQVPLGVLLYDENKLDEMSHVLEHYMQFVPKVEASGFILLPSGEKVEYDNTKFNAKLLGGDQLTAVRVRSAQALRDTLDSATQRFEGLIPVIEDWHARTILLQVCLMSKLHIVTMIA